MKPYHRENGHEVFNWIWKKLKSSKYFLFILDPLDLLLQTVLLYIHGTILYFKVCFIVDLSNNEGKVRYSIRRIKSTKILMLYHDWNIILEQFIAICSIGHRHHSIPIIVTGSRYFFFVTSLIFIEEVLLLDVKFYCNMKTKYVIGG